MQAGYPPPAAAPGDASALPGAAAAPSSPPAASRPLAGRTIAFLEARRSEELTRLVVQQGGTPYVAPALREVPVADLAPLRTWLAALAAARFDVVLFLTGVGCRALLERAAEDGELNHVLAALAATRVVAR